jgi:tRNA(fMet)-specific endonuclease VapC
MEILQGRHDSILKAANATELRKASGRFQEAVALLSDYVLVYPDDASCQHFEALLKKARRKMRRPDLLIASIVLAHKALLVTRNLDDFKAVTGLRVENWAD